MIKNDMREQKISLTQYSQGGGCGCKISPEALKTILYDEQSKFIDPYLIVSNKTYDDAAVYDLGGGNSIISTTDFFMPIVDNPLDFGSISATNAINDVFAMGGKPIMAIAILGWPIGTLATEIACKVIEGGRSTCQQVGIALAGGHSIGTSEPIFGLAVTGIVRTDQIKRNDTAEVGCHLFLTKPLGTGILTTAEKKSLLKPEHFGIATKIMRQINLYGADFASINEIKAMTDITGFGLLGHLIELCQGSGVQARIWYNKIPKLPGVEEYIVQGAVPIGTHRNFSSYGHLVSKIPKIWSHILCDPQTSGGLLLAVIPESKEIYKIAAKYGIIMTKIGELVAARKNHPLIEIF